MPGRVFLGRRNTVPSRARIGGNPLIPEAPRNDQCRIRTTRLRRSPTDSSVAGARRASAAACSASPTALRSLGGRCSALASSSGSDIFDDNERARFARPQLRRCRAQAHDAWSGGRPQRSERDAHALAVFLKRPLRMRKLDSASPSRIRRNAYAGFAEFRNPVCRDENRRRALLDDRRALGPVFRAEPVAVAGGRIARPAVGEQH